jgi:peptidyl-prolyl cis-trans isomerase B (cyclophilin B)
MKKTILLFLMIILVVITASCAKKEDAGLSAESYTIEIEIENYGTITAVLDAKTAPITVENFIGYVKEGYYNGLTFHRIIEGFMMQGGGSANPPASIVGEFASNGHANPLKHTRGAISMARTPMPDSASSQFFIVHKDSPHLDGDYACFGYVTEGIEVVDAVCENVMTYDNNGSVAEEDQPVIRSITIRTK